VAFQFQTAPEVLTPLEVGSVLRISRKKLYDELRAGRIPCRRLGRKILISRTELERWLNTQAAASDPTSATALESNPPCDSFATVGPPITNCLRRKSKFDKTKQEAEQHENEI
jgi:excisionase family DNA binding protein